MAIADCLLESRTPPDHRRLLGRVQPMDDKKRWVSFKTTQTTTSLAEAVLAQAATAAGI